MKLIFTIFLAVFSSSLIFSQGYSSKKNVDLSTRPSDHLLFQVSSDRWLDMPDSIDAHKKNNSRGANVYFMIDKPFQSNQHYSVSFGLGFSTSHLFFSRMNIGIDGKNPVMNFSSLDTSDHFKKYKLSTSYLELPVELRFFSNPAAPNKSFKIALGVKVATLLNAHTKGKTWEDKSGNTIQDFTVKVSSKSYFNTKRLSATARVGYGNFSLFGSYNLSSSIFKDKVAAEGKLLQLGLTISGL